MTGGTIIRVHGWIMLQKVPAGTYRIETGTYNGRKTYTFFRPRGRKPIVQHYSDSVDCWTRGRPDDLNRIEIVSQ